MDLLATTLWTLHIGKSPDAKAHHRLPSNLLLSGKLRLSHFEQHSFGDSVQQTPHCCRKRSSAGVGSF
jgi:hypothetical protein